MKAITDQTKVALPIASWWHLAIVVGTIVGVYIAMRGDISAAITQSEHNAQELIMLRDRISDQRYEILKIQEGLGYFRQQYEADRKREGLR